MVTFINKRLGDVERGYVGIFKKPIIAQYLMHAGASVGQRIFVFYAG